MAEKQADIPVETLRALRSGEEWAYNDVYARYANPLKDFLTAIIRNEEDARELNHDIFMSLWTDREKIVPEKGIRGFLYLRARHLAMNWFDSQKVRNKYEAFCRHADFDYVLPSDEHMIAHETKILIEIVLRGMSERQQAIYRMRKEEEKSIDEIAQELNISPSTVKNNMSMIIKSIREVLLLFFLIFLP